MRSIGMTGFLATSDSLILLFPRAFPLALVGLMKGLLLLPLLFPVIPVSAQESDIQCPGGTTVEMRLCASQSLRESKQALKKQLPQATLEKWKAATQEACGVAYAPYRQGSIYPQVVVGCEDRLNRLLLDELRRLGKR